MAETYGIEGLGIFPCRPKSPSENKSQMREYGDEK